MKEQNQFIQNNCYAYSYDKLNNVYLIRGIEPDYFCECRINRIPDELIENLVFEEYVRNNRIMDVKDKGIISYSQNHYYAVVDFMGRSFTEEQVMDIFYGKNIKGKSIKEVHPLSYTTVDTDKDKTFVKRLINKITRN